MNILYTSREQVQVAKFSAPVAIGIPLAAILIQSFVSKNFFWLATFDLPLLVVIYFAVARRHPIGGMLTGGVVGILQDSLTYHPVGLYGIAKTVVGFIASSLGVKIDVENPGSRMLMTLAFYVMHQGIYYLVAHGMAGEAVQLRWGHLMIAAAGNAILAVPLFAILDRFKMRV